MTPFDLIVIGSGPGGQKAAVQGAKAGKKVAVIEAQTSYGGACLFQGTVPSKCFRESVYRFSLSSSGSLRHDIDHSTVPILSKLPDMQRLWKRRNRVIQSETQVIFDQLTRNQIKLFQGHGSLISEHEVEVKIFGRNETIRLRGEKIILATGARPVAPPHLPVDGKNVFDSNSVLTLERTPKSIIVLGAGVIGCEYASMFLMAGTKVTLVDRNKDVLASIDREIVDHLKERFEHFNMKILTGRDTDRLEVTSGRVRVHLKDGEVIEAETAMIAMGRQSNTQGLGLEKLGINMNERGTVLVNKKFQTNIPNIYAVGDMIGFPALASTSMEQGRIACCHAFDIEGQTAGEMPEFYPYGIYTIPEISTVGMTEEQAREKGIDYVVGRANYREVVRGQIVGDRWGLLKLVVERNSLKILGVHIVGDNAPEIVHIGQAVMALGWDVRFFIHNVFNYPTFAEAYKTAALYAVNRAGATDHGTSHETVRDLKRDAA